MGTMTRRKRAAAKPTRVALRWTGPGAVALHGAAHPVPRVVQPGGVVVVDADAADGIIAGAELAAFAAFVLVPDDVDTSTPREGDGGTTETEE
jgi:hypothetical protein